MSTDKAERKDRSITVRFSHEEAQAINNIATEYNTCLSDVIRCATKGELDKYLGRVKYVDPKQGSAIKHNIFTIMDAITETRDHLRRIGVNLNQIVRRVNAGDMKELTESGKIMTKAELDEVTRNLERVTKEAGEIILCIAE